MEFFDPHQNLDIDGYWPIFELQKVCQKTHRRNLSPPTSKESAYSTGFPPILSLEKDTEKRERYGEVQVLVSTPSSIRLSGLS